MPYLLFCLLSPLSIINSAQSAQAQTAPAAHHDTPIETEEVQISKLDLYSLHIKTYSQLYPQEKAWLHFDNSGYFQGDTIWFKAYVRSTHPRHPQAFSSVLYVDLVSPTGRIVHTRKLKIENGTCHGEIPLIQTQESIGGSFNHLVAGFYEVRAYTRYMLNWGTDAVFSRVFPVYDRPAFPGDYRLHMTPSEEALPPVRPERKKQKKLNVTFYPEGGHSIVGLPGRTAYRVTDAWGNPIEAEGEFQTSEGLTLPTATIHDGMGILLYTPASGTDAHPSLRLHPKGAPQESKTFSLPEAVTSGYSFSVNTRHPEYINIQVQASPDRAARILGISIQQEGNLCYYDTLHIAGGETGFRKLPCAMLPQGVCQATLFDSEGILADRLVFISHPKAAQDSLQIDLSPSGLYTGELCRLRLQTSTPDGTPVPASLSIAIRDAETTCALPVCEDPRVTQLLASEVRGYIHKPEYYFENSDALHRQALDLLMMTQGWRKYEWREMAGLANRPFNHYLETGLILNGHVFNRRGRTPIVDRNILIKMYNPERTLVLNGNCESDSAGNFNFKFDDFYGKWELSIHTDEERKRPRTLQYRIDRHQTPKLRAYEAEELKIPAYRTDTARYGSLDEVQTLAEVEIQKRKKKKEGIHIVLDVEKENDRLMDQGTVCTDVETFLTEMDLGFSVQPAHPQLLAVGPEDTSTASMEMTFLPQCVLWGDDADLICMNRQETSFVYSDTRRPAWALELPISEIKQIELYDYTFMKSRQKEIEELYTDSLIQSMLDIGDNIATFAQIDSVKLSLKTQRKGLIKVIAKPKIEQRSAPKNYRITTFDGYYRPQTFTASYEHCRPKAEDFRRTLYWNPSVETDSLGQAEISFRHNSQPHNVTFNVAGQPQSPAHNGKLSFRSITVAPQK